MGVVLFWSLSEWAELATIIGSLLAVAGAVTLYIEIRRKRISDGRKTLMFQDFLRHLFVNTAIVEIVRQRVNESGGFDKVYPEEGVLERMKFLPDDFAISRFRTSDKYFDEMHDMELLMRNYCVSLDVANKHLMSQEISTKVKIDDLNDVDNRAKSLMVDIYKMSECLKLKNIKPLHELISDKYSSLLDPLKPAAGVNNFSDAVINKARTKNLNPKFFDAEQLELLYNKYLVLRKDVDGYVRVIGF